VRPSSSKVAVSSEKVKVPEVVLEVPRPTPPVRVIGAANRSPIAIAVSVDDVSSFSKNVAAREVVQLQVIASVYAEEVDAFYAGAIPFVPPVVQQPGRIGVMAHPLMSRRPNPHPKVKTLGVPDSW
jgi:hypothetical protein